ncbi:xanthine dehydrogenase family protein molybdopterin-binding subunit [Echinimonas agarilytica]|uniref:Molybdopterin-dependent oxidoreductase n=1 Tax=Echinimonas agarilytica TaxID=1215918 RepID=A0AA42B7U4_9GAMM|nr:molybdopterin cofactor-binding domain-containing protein [Echinimonas agarilytica]MCM2679718.1 molybdopterin-dependent oxidoreductase [Echinimonas agarilytica]
MDIKLSSPVENVSRRRFLKALGVTSGGFVLGGVVPLSAPAWADESAAANQLNLFISINTNNQVDIVCHRSEMGQGVRTSVPQVIADELDADWDLVNVVQGMANDAYGSQNTDGSTSIRNAYMRLRQLGASARTMLEQAAAQVWKVPVEQCKSDFHKVVNVKTGQSLSYGELAPVAAGIKPPETNTVSLKEKSEFRYIGKGLASVDLPDVVNGTTEFGQDIQIPGMVIASIERCPVFGGTMKTFDAAAAKKVKGVLDVITIKATPGAPVFHALGGVAVLASNTYAAHKGREKLNIEWDLGPNVSHNSDEYLQQRIDAVNQPAKPVRFAGDVKQAFADSDKQVAATYTVPYLVHAPMEPPAATAMMHTDGSCEIWACTQAPQGVRDHAAKALGLKKEQVRVHVTLLGGAFGRKAKADFAVEAALLAQASGKPVKVVWSREDDIQHSYYHAISAQHYEAALDDKDALSAWVGRTSFPTIASTFNLKQKEPMSFEQGGGFADVPFAVENISCEVTPVDSHVRIGWMRSVANIHHGFGVGSFVDEIAAAKQQDPKQCWIELLGNHSNVDLNQGDYKNPNYGASAADHPIDTARYKNVIELACGKAGWGKKLPAGEGLGLSVHRSFLAYVAVVSHVKVEGKKLTVKHMYCAADSGTIANLDRVESQMEGAMIFGLSIALMSEISTKNGAIEQSNFNDYMVVRMNQSPDIDVQIVQSDALPAGVGEPGVPPVAASIANAVYAATGKRYRDLPLNKAFRV